LGIKTKRKLATGRPSRAYLKAENLRHLPSRPKGLPYDYRTAYDALVYKLRLLGCTKAQIADVFETSVNVLDEWLARVPSFNQSYFSGGVQADARVAKALMHRALGYSHSAEKIQFDREGNELRATYMQHYPPDTTAAEIWLTNRQPELWKRRGAVIAADANGVGEIVVRVIGGLPDDA